MSNDFQRSPMPTGYRIALVVVALLGAAIGFFTAILLQSEKFDLVTSLICAVVGAGLGGGLVFVFWMIKRTREEDD